MHFAYDGTCLIISGVSSVIFTLILHTSNRFEPACVPLVISFALSYAPFFCCVIHNLQLFFPPRVKKNMVIVEF